MNFELKKSDNFVYSLSPFSKLISLSHLQRHLRHLKSNRRIPVPLFRYRVYIGKPNLKLPPDINLDHFAHSEIVSHIHARLKLESGIWWITDSHSRLGTYLNDIRLIPDVYHQLHRGDRISFGGDDMAFVFES